MSAPGATKPKSDNNSHCVYHSKAWRSRRRLPTTACKCGPGRSPGRTLPPTTYTRYRGWRKRCPWDRASPVEGSSWASGAQWGSLGLIPPGTTPALINRHFLAQAEKKMTIFCGPKLPNALHVWRRRKRREWAKSPLTPCCSVVNTPAGKLRGQMMPAHENHMLLHSKHTSAELGRMLTVTCLDPLTGCGVVSTCVQSTHAHIHTRYGDWEALNFRVRKKNPTPQSQQRILKLS